MKLAIFFCLLAYSVKAASGLGSVPLSATPQLFTNVNFYGGDTNRIYIIGSSQDGTYTNLGLRWSLAGDSPCPVYQSGAGKFLFFDCNGDLTAGNYYAVSAAQSSNFTNNGTGQAFHGIVGGAWIADSGTPPTVSYYTPSVIGNGGTFVGDASGLTNFPSILTGLYILNNLGKGTNTIFFFAVSNVQVDITNYGGVAGLMFQNPDSSTNVVGLWLGKRHTGSDAQIYWNPVHTFSDARSDGECVITAPRIALAAGSESLANFDSFGTANEIQMGFANGSGDTHSPIHVYKDSSGNMNTASNATSLPIYFDVISSNGNTVLPAIQGWAQDATGGKGHAGMRLYYSFDKNLQAAKDAGMNGRSFNYTNSFPWAYAVYGGAADGNGLVNIYGQLYSTNFVGDGGNLTNVSRYAAFPQATSTFSSGTHHFIGFGGLDGTTEANVSSYASELPVTVSNVVFRLSNLVAGTNFVAILNTNGSRSSYSNSVNGAGAGTTMTISGAFTIPAGATASWEVYGNNASAYAGNVSIRQTMYDKTR